MPARGIPGPFPAGRPRREDDVQLAGDCLGVFIERLEEVAQAEEEDGVRVATLYVEILSPQGRGHVRGVLRGAGRSLGVVEAYYTAPAQNLEPAWRHTQPTAAGAVPP